MAWFPSESSGGALKATSSWSDAVANASSFIVVYAPYNDGYNRVFSFLVPKATLTASDVYYMSGVSPSTGFYCQLCVSTTNCDPQIFVNGSAKSSTPTFYYD